MGVYDGLPYVRDAVRSVLGQTYKDFELLVIDDCSTDGTAAELERVADGDDRLRIVRNDENVGLTRSLNRGLDEARGEYVARHDADDRSAPERLARQVAYLNANPDVAVVGTGARLVDASDHVIDTRVVLRTPTLADFRAKNHLIHGSILARRSVLRDHGGYDEFFEYSQDYDLWLRLAESNALRNLPDPLYDLREHTGSIYFDRMEESTLYATLARGRSAGRFSAETVDRVRAEGIGSLYDYLSPAEKRAFHESLARVCLRYEHTDEACEQVETALSFSATPKTYLVYGLTCIGPRPVRLLRKLLRKAMNGRNRLRNRLGPWA